MYLPQHLLAADLKQNETSKQDKDRTDPTLLAVAYIKTLFGH